MLQKNPHVLLLNVENIRFTNCICINVENIRFTTCSTCGISSFTKRSRCEIKYVYIFKLYNHELQSVVQSTDNSSDMIEYVC